MATLTPAAPGRTAQRAWATRLRTWLGLPTAPASPRQIARITGGYPFVGELATLCSDFPPVGWALCNGQGLSTSDYSVLFSLIGYTYGGNATTFNLPDLRGRVPVGIATNSASLSGLSPYDLGQLGGQESVSLNTSQLPPHTHALPASAAPGTTASPLGAVPADSGTGSAQYVPNRSGPAVAQNLGSTGGDQGHSNVQPVLALNYIIALDGIFPQ